MQSLQAGFGRGLPAHEGLENFLEGRLLLEWGKGAVQPLPGAGLFLAGGSNLFCRLVAHNSGHQSSSLRGKNAKGRGCGLNHSPRSRRASWGGRGLLRRHEAVLWAGCPAGEQFARVEPHALCKH